MRILNATEVADWVRDALLNPARTSPIVAVTTRPHDGGSWIDPRALHEAIGAQADIFFLETGNAPWELADALPSRLDAYGGAVRIWWPGLTVTSNPYHHRLHFVRSPEEAKMVFDEIVAAVRERVGGLTAGLQPVVEACVTSVKVSDIELVAGNLRGPLRFADISITDLARSVEVGTGLEADPSADERAFMRAVRTTYARMFDEDDRMQHPLLRIRVGPPFLDSLRALEGAGIEKVLEVCAQVAADAVHAIVSREVHQLRAGRAGQPRIRATDEAQAWRCALQVKSPSARRLHWWRVPGSAGSTIEFAGADVHDEFGIA